MNVYPFIIRGPTRASRVHRIRAQGKNFKDALIKVLSVYPAKFVNFKFARNMDLNTVKQIAINLSKKTKGVEHAIWLNEKEGEFYISFKNDKGFTILVEDETNLKGLEIGSARLNRFSKQSVWVSGEQTKEVAPQPTNVVAEKISPKAKKSPVKKEVKTELENEFNMKNKKQSKKAAKKNGAAKKAVSKADWGKTVSISIKDMRAGIKKGFQYRDPQGVIQTENYMSTRARQDHVRDGIYVAKVEKI
jgi:hypothetical protein